MPVRRRKKGPEESEESVDAAPPPPPLRHLCQHLSTARRLIAYLQPGAHEAQKHTRKNASVCVRMCQAWMKHSQMAQPLGKVGRAMAEMHVRSANSVGNRFRTSRVAKSSTVGSMLAVCVGSVTCVETAPGHTLVTMPRHYWLRAMKKLISTYASRLGRTHCRMTWGK